MSRENMLRVRFSDDEYDRLKSLADGAGISMSQLVRDHLGKVRIRNRDDEKERVVMLNRINANLNMIARWVNTHKGSADSIEVVSHLMVIERHIAELSK